jgi:GTPase involved in cell partitioning and DNA repair
MKEEKAIIESIRKIRDCENRNYNQKLKIQREFENYKKDMLQKKAQLQSEKSDFLNNKQTKLLKDHLNKKSQESSQIIAKEESKLTE